MENRRLIGACYKCQSTPHAILRLLCAQCSDRWSDEDAPIGTLRVGMAIWPVMTASAFGGNWYPSEKKPLASHVEIFKNTSVMPIVYPNIEATRFRKFVEDNNKGATRWYIYLFPGLIKSNREYIAGFIFDVRRLVQPDLTARI